MKPLQSKTIHFLVRIGPDFLLGKERNFQASKGKNRIVRPPLTHLQNNCSAELCKTDAAGRRSERCQGNNAGPLGLLGGGGAGSLASAVSALAPLAAILGKKETSRKGAEPLGFA